MLEIRDIHIDNIGSGCVTDNSAPEVSFSLRSDIPGTFLRNAVIQLGDRASPAEKSRPGLCWMGWI